MRRAQSSVLFLMGLLVSACLDGRPGSDRPVDQTPDAGELAPIAAPQVESPATADRVPTPAPTAPTADAGGVAAGDAGTEMAAGVCDRGREDPVQSAFCGDTRPTLTGLSDLFESLGLQLGKAPEGEGPTANDITGLAPASTSVAALGHSTALSGHRVSPINPRLIFIYGSMFIAYQRGVQKVEVIAFGSEHGRPHRNFYLFRFEQACNRMPGGCTPGDLYTPRVEHDWLSWTLADDEALKNTPDDCRQCHQRGREQPVLLMRELNSPWTHFMQPIPEPATEIGPGPQGPDLMLDYQAAKGDELYGGFRLDSLNPSAPFVLESAVGTDQPVLFDAPGIENERFPYDPEAGYPNTPGASPTWEAAYDAFKRGEQLALPYLEVRAVDADKQARLSDAYARYRAGALAAEALPDLADIFPDDPHQRARIGLQTDPDADAVGTLIQACGSCHNDVLDPSISRARFNVNLWRLEPSELALAIERMERAPDSPGVMPPPEARKLDPQAKQRLLDYLRQDPLSQAPDARLLRAAELGMAGGANRRSPTRPAD